MNSLVEKVATKFAEKMCGNSWKRNVENKAFQSFSHKIGFSGKVLPKFSLGFSTRFYINFTEVKRRFSIVST